MYVDGGAFVDGNLQLNGALIVGYDLCNDYSQISYFNHSQSEPKTISTVTGEERFQIPCVLYKRENIDKWYFGEEAVREARIDNKAVIGELLAFNGRNETVYVHEKEYKKEALLEIFIKRTLSLLIYEKLNKKIPDIIVFTLESLNSEIINTVKSSAYNIGIAPGAVYIQEHKESFVEYTINQKSELWTNRVELIQYNDKGFFVNELVIDTKTIPNMVYIENKCFEHIRPYNEMYCDEDKDTKNNRLDLLVQESLSEHFDGKTVSCVFIMGEGFEEDWPKETFRFLCLKRRVFQGKNLFTKGACYTAAAKYFGNDRNHLYLGEHKLKVNIGIELIDNGRESYYSLISAGENWYDANGNCEIIPDDETSIGIKLIPLDNKDIRTIIVNMHDLPKRPNKTIRLQLNVSFESADKGKIIVRDLGFGEFYKSSEKVWEHQILL